MNPNKTFLALLGIATLSAGCVGTGPNTQRGAVGGAVAGAVIGGVVGNNRGSGNAASGAAIGAVAGGMAGAAVGNNTDQQRGTVHGRERSPYDDPRYGYENHPQPQPDYRQPAPVYSQGPQPVYQQQAPVYQQQAPVYVQHPPQSQVIYVEQPPMPPPAPREVVTMRPAREAIWVNGYYTYVGRGQYAWVPGHWEVPPPGRYSRFEHPRWERRSNGYVYVRGQWR